VLDAEYKGHTQSWAIQISEDGHYYILSEVYTLGPSKMPGFLSPQAGSEAPTIQITKDATRALVGDFQDLTIDPDKVNLAKVNLRGVPFRGKANGTLVMIEYSDLECPYCRDAHKALEKQLLPAFGDKLKWIFKHNPLPGHKWSMSAAIAAACGGMQKPEIGWKMEAGFFERQDQINPEIAPADFRTKAVEIARSAGADEGRFAACFDKQESKRIVDADKQEAASLGLSSTPAFVINGRIVHGFRSFELLKEVLDSLLIESK
jgi:protein-disulfide isomerase